MRERMALVYDETGHLSYALRQGSDGICYWRRINGHRETAAVFDIDTMMRRYADNFGWRCEEV